MGIKTWIGEKLGRFAAKLAGHNTDDVARAASHEADDTARAATRHEPHLGDDPVRTPRPPRSEGYVRQADGSWVPESQLAGHSTPPSISGSPTHAPATARPQTPLPPSMPHAPLGGGYPALSAKAEIARAGIGMARNVAGGFIENHPAIATGLGWVTAAALGVGGAYYGLGKFPLQTIEGSSDDPGSFMAISTVHYTQGWDLDASNGSSFADTVEQMRMERNPAGYMQRYEAKLNDKAHPWAPTSAAKTAFDKAKENVAKAEESKARPLAAAASAAAGVDRAKAEQIVAEAQKKAADDRAIAVQQQAEREKQAQKTHTESLDLRF